MIAINSNQMMIEGMQNNGKVIVVLSKKYKEKANKFEGAMGQEFKIILEYMKQKKNKYIFVFFGNADRNEITPTGIIDVDILDLKWDQDTNNFNSLFSKNQTRKHILFFRYREGGTRGKKD